MPLTAVLLRGLSRVSRLGLAVRPHIPMDIEIRDHPAIDELDLHEVAREFDVLRLTELALDQIADAVGVISLVSQDGGAGIEALQQTICRRPVMGLTGCQAEPDREPWRIDDRVNLGRETASGATEAVIQALLFAAMGSKSDMSASQIVADNSCSLPLPLRERRSSMATKGRLSREDWIAIARKTLIASGVDDVKVDVLARRLRVMRGSFYWHFKSRQDLLDALLDDWKANNSREIAVVEARETNDGGDLLELFRVWLGEDPSYPSFDFAIRGWARKSKKVAGIVRQIDENWISLIQSYFERSGLEPPESFVRARIMYFHQVGYFALSLEESLSERARLAPYYYEALTGMAAPEGMVDAMLALEKSRPRLRRSMDAASSERPTSKKNMRSA